MEDDDDLEDIWQDIRAKSISRKDFRGSRSVSTGECSVWMVVNNDPSIPLPFRQDELPSANGFEWGYVGAGPAHLSYAILREHFGRGGKSMKRARLLHRPFLVECVSRLTHVSWELSAPSIANIVKTMESQIEGQQKSP